MYDFLDKIGLKAVLEAVKGKIPSSLPANGGNADTVSGRHSGRIACVRQDGTYFDDTAKNVHDAYLQWDGVRLWLKTYSNLTTAVNYADVAQSLQNGTCVYGTTNKIDVVLNWKPSQVIIATAQGAVYVATAINDNGFSCSSLAEGIARHYWAFR